MHVEITSYVLRPNSSPKQPSYHSASRPNMPARAQREPRVLPEPTSLRRHLSETLTQLEHCSSLEITVINARTDSKITPAPDTRSLKPTSPALVTAGWHNSRDSWIQSCCQIVHTFKTLQHPFINYICMAILTIKCDLSSYKKIITYRLYSGWDPKYPTTLTTKSSNLYKSFSNEKGELLITTESPIHSIFFAFLQKMILTPEGLQSAPHRCSWSKRCFVLLTRSIRSVQLSVAENPHHTTLHFLYIVYLAMNISLNFAIKLPCYI